MRWAGTFILAPHLQRTLERMGSEAVVLCLQDTTELDFNGQDIEGLGPLSYEAQRGMYLHATYAVSTCPTVGSATEPDATRPAFRLSRTSPPSPSSHAA
jgi:hypothetical protein